MGRTPSVTGLRACGPGRVEVHLDGAPWRRVPLDAAVAARLSVGVALDRERARELNRALRRARALTKATRLLRAGMHTSVTLDRRLDAGGVGETERRATIGTLRRAGLLDDARTARARADWLVDRGAGDAMIAADLAERGLDAAAVEATLAELRPERERATAIVARRGATPATLRRLAARGFAEETLEPFVAAVSGEGVG